LKKEKIMSRRLITIIELGAAALTLFLLPTMGIQAQSLHHGRETCKQGFVWREAGPGDRVCVTPDTRSQTADDNRRAHSRRIPGEDTCKQGYVWREAFSGDLVCVPPQTRAQAREDNNLAPSRLVQ
jgi:hypothetical protein